MGRPFRVLTRSGHYPHARLYRSRYSGGYKVDEFLGFFKAMHYNGGHPASAKSRDLCRREVKFFWTRCNDFARATMRLATGIIDCAFRNSEKELSRSVVFRYSI